MGGKIEPFPPLSDRARRRTASSPYKARRCPWVAAPIWRHKTVVRVATERSRYSSGSPTRRSRVHSASACAVDRQDGLGGRDVTFAHRPLSRARHRRLSAVGRVSLRPMAYDWMVSDFSLFPGDPATEQAGRVMLWIAASIVGITKLVVHIYSAISLPNRLRNTRRINVKPGTWPPRSAPDPRGRGQR